MSDMLGFLKTRRSAKPLAMGGPAPSDSDIKTMLTIAARVPDHGKLAPWRFLVIAGDSRDRLSAEIARIHAADHPDASDDSLSFEGRRLSRAPLVIGVVSCARPHAKIPEWEQVLSAGAVCFNLCLAANAMGYATCWLTEWYGYDRRFLSLLGLAPAERLAGFIHIGRVEAPNAERERPVLADIVTWI